MCHAHTSCIMEILFSVSKFSTQHQQSRTILAILFLFQFVVVVGFCYRTTIQLKNFKRNLITYNIWIESRHIWIVMSSLFRSMLMWMFIVGMMIIVVILTE